MLRKNAPNILQQFLLYYRKKGCISFEIQKENMLPKVTKGLWFFMYVWIEQILKSWMIFMVKCKQEIVEIPLQIYFRIMSGQSRVQCL